MTKFEINIYIALLLPIILCYLSLHTIGQGHIGVKYRFKQIQPFPLDSISFYIPGIEEIYEVKYTEDADEVYDVKCVSKEGVDILIKSIQIANQIDKNSVLDVVKRYGLDYDKKLVTHPLDQKMREICADLTVDELEIHRFHELDELLKDDIQKQLNDKYTNITINWVRVTGISVPKEIKEKRLALASEKAEKILVEEQNKRSIIIKEHEEIIARKEADIRIQKAESNNRELLINMLAEKQRKDVEFSILISEGEARSKKIKLEAEALSEMDKLPNYYHLENTKALATGTKMIYWGNDLPNTVISSEFIRSH
jgi:regulator of protease activity HflC (stomatin/prohibitin superfamily)